MVGHLVFSTLHTNDAPRAITRLLDMDVEPFLLTSSIIGVIAQHLIRLNCPSCTEEYTPGEEELAFYYEITGENTAPRFFQGQGCENCLYIGFRGRTAIYEVMPVDGKMREIILNSGHTEEIKHHVLTQGMITPLTDGVQRAKEGKTTLKEVLQVAYTMF